MAANERRRGRLTIRLLGQIEVLEGSRSLVVSGPNARALLADLALHANQTVAVDKLVADIWGDDPPSTAPKMVQILVSQLRRAMDLEPGAPVELTTRERGYQLSISGDAVDVQRFETLVGRAEASRRLDPAAAGRLYREALDLWRGPALADLTEFPFAASAVVRLDELRMQAFEEWVDAGLEVGRDAELVPDLRRAVDRDPLRERLRGQLMVALYRTGRQADALQVYVETHRMLADELGIEPSPELQILQRAILNQDPSLRRARLEPGWVQPAPGRADPMNASLVRVGRLRAWPVRSRPRLGIVGLVALAVVPLIVVTAGRLAAGRPSASNGPGSGADGGLGVTVVANSVALMDTTRDRVITDVPVGTAPGPVALDTANVWVGNVGDRTVSQVDRSSRRVVQTFGQSSAPTSLTSGDGILWVGNGFAGTLSRILIAYDQESGPFFPTSQLTGLLAVGTSKGAVWVGVPDAELVRLDPQSERAVTTIALAERARAITTLLDRVWYIGFSGSDVHEVDPNDLLSPLTVHLPGDSVALAAGDGSIWVATAGPNELLEIDATTATVVRKVDLPETPAALAVTTAAIWTLTTSGSLERVDLRGQSIGTFDLGRPLSAVSGAGDELWVSAR